ncbi:uncharacterized protein LOC117173363 isoform X2 [Belonocnema kinseyi]|uniref:uncharacterized protein LOC117173363 isoform X2 n=1 Tax=Belonocnema kinseyi TaxID=2817044 RepID=UPI00143D2BB7|nr:uncharacterized protein LOC117173363 isoform X2 [Belonocnema kinseyi]
MKLSLQSNPPKNNLVGGYVKIHRLDPTEVKKNGPSTILENYAALPRSPAPDPLLRQNSVSHRSPEIIENYFPLEVPPRKQPIPSPFGSRYISMFGYKSTSGSGSGTSKPQQTN